MFLVHYFLLAFLLLMMLTFLDDQASFNLNGQCHSYLRNGIIMSSPNMSYVPEFPGFEDSGIFLRGDGFYGPQEFSCWPQLYSQSLCHYSAIPSKPTVITDKFWNSILFRDFSCEDW